ncbi:MULTISPECIES: twin-arginine translocation signal domain-containing protein [Rhizobium]|uniref:twin-arginine translocation signal domain-containing protein n=1 Tax=Rhizobium TaxID=379 RepID=UPI000B87F97C|nr:twin-arginine translocation signal domain-containing protein [Rhizobium miluonense]
MSQLQTVAISRRTFLTAAAALPLMGAPITANAAEKLGFGELYKSFGPLGLEFSDKVKQLSGKDVAIKGFMAPPLKAEAAFFVLTEIPMSLCPFCSSDADWPDNIVVVYLSSKQTFVQFNAPIMARGVLEFGSWTDPETGFISQLRLKDASFKTV